MEEKKPSIFLEFLKKNWLNIITVLYLVLPVDFIPDAIPLVGQVDDVTLLLVDLVKSYIDFSKSNEKSKS